MYDSSNVERQMKRQESISYYTNSGEQNENATYKAFTEFENVKLRKLEKVVSDGDSIEGYPPPKWCVVRQILLNYGNSEQKWIAIAQFKTNYTVSQVKVLIEKLLNIKKQTQDLVFNDTFLKDDESSLASYGINQGDEISLVLKTTTTTKPRNFASEAQLLRSKSTIQKEILQELGESDALTRETEVHKKKELKISVTPESSPEVIYRKRRLSDGVRDLKVGQKVRNRRRPSRDSQKYIDSIEASVNRVNRTIESNSDATRNYKIGIEAAQKYADRRFSPKNSQQSGKNRGSGRKSYGLNRSMSIGFQRTESTDSFFDTVDVASDLLTNRANSKSVFRSLGLLSSIFHKSRSRSIAADKVQALVRVANKKCTLKTFREEKNEADNVEISTELPEELQGLL